MSNQNKKTKSVQSSSNSAERNCSCGQPASLLTVRKEGENQGKKFYVKLKF
jgi:hypothetical protein